MKILIKKELVREKQVNQIFNEKRILRAVEHPFLVDLKFSIKDNSYLYLGMEFVNGGEMFTHLRK